MLSCIPVTGIETILGNKDKILYSMTLNNEGKRNQESNATLNSQTTTDVILF